MFEEGVEYATEAKGGLDDVGCVFADYVIGECADPKEKPTKNGLDCLNVLRCIVTRSGVSVIGFPSASIMAELKKT